MQQTLGLPDPAADGTDRGDIARYMHLTGRVMPQLAVDRRWPVRHDHCLRRIVLDTLCAGVWYDHIARPAWRHMTAAQARAAVDLCERIIAGDADIRALNARSLAWRGKAR